MSAEPLLRWLAVDPALAATARPVDAIVDKLARSLGIECVFVGELLHTTPEKARTLAWWRHGRHRRTVEYSADGSPYEAPKGGSVFCMTHPLTNLKGLPFGHVGIASGRRFRSERRFKQLLAACAPRIAGEVERLRRETRQRTREAAGAAEIRLRKRQLLDSVREAETLLRETHHRVKNDLQVVASLLTMQVDAASDVGVRSALFDAITRISAIALIHAQLCEAPNLALVDMHTFVRDLVGNLERTFLDATTHVMTSVNVDRFNLPLRLATPCGLLITELLTNAYQHAFVNTEGGLVEIRMTTDGRMVTVVVRDNGPGLPSQNEGHQAAGLGLQLIRLLATKQLRGDVSVVSHYGTEFTITFPLDVANPSPNLASGNLHTHDGHDG